ncbi:MAG: glycoside hydrolase family 16 protein [Chitinophagaceae bacterium]|jgi:hypothetical protein|nr:glycoside hydrolase family 16 protein [Chitinophagaceae bacterium]
MKRNYKPILFYLLCSCLFFACSKGGSSPNNGGNTAPTNIKISVQIVGVTNATPNGDGSGTVNLSFSATNANAYQVILPTENKTFTMAGSSGTVTCTFSSAPGTTTQYPITVIAYNNAVKKDTTIYVTVFCNPVGKNLVWSDEFNGTSLNTSIWNYDLGNLNVNNEKEYYTKDAENISVSGGNLQITALNSTKYSGYNYTSARINTQNNYSFKYGWVEMRAKLPGDPGTWPALWLLGNNISGTNSVGWPACGEIDMMEAATNTWGANVTGSSLHWGTLTSSGASNNTNKKLTVSGLTSDFHLYQMDWRADHIAFYVDGVKIDSVANNSSMPFNQNFFFIFNVAVGGDMGGNPINLGSGSTMYVDYVRVYN